MFTSTWCLDHNSAPEWFFADLDQETGSTARPRKWKCNWDPEVKLQEKFQSLQEAFLKRLKKAGREKEVLFFEVVWVISPGRSLWRRQQRLQSTRTRCWEDTAHPPVTTPGHPAAKQDNTVSLVGYWRQNQIPLFTRTVSTQLDL